MKPQPLDLKEMNKLADEIIEMFCIIDDRPYPESTGVWGMDTELFSADENETARDKARKEVIKKFKQRLKSTCEFYLRYKDKPELFWEEQQDNLNNKEKRGFLTFDDRLRGLPEEEDRDGWDSYDELEIIQDYNSWLFKLAFKNVLGDKKCAKELLY